MVSDNRDDDDLTRSSKRNKRSYRARSTKDKTICNEGETSGLLISGDLDVESNQDVLSERSDEVVGKVSRSIVSLVLCDGDTEFFSCSGIAVQCKRTGPVSCFMTSTSLVKALNDKRKDHGNLKIVARHEDNSVVGFLGGYDLDHGIAAVHVKDFPDLDGVVFQCPDTFAPLTNVVALGRDKFGKLLSTHGVLKFETLRDLLSPMLSTCKTSKEYEGGLLVDVDGNFLGMNFSSCTEGTFCLPEVILSQRWIRILSQEEMCPVYSSSSKIRVGESSITEILESHHAVTRDMLEAQFGDFESFGYPKCPKSTLTDDIVLANYFEEPFGDVHGKGVWSKLSETVPPSILENIVALASFNGEKRIFACSGCFIEWNGCTTILTAASLIRNPQRENDIVKNLRIEVSLPNKERAAGILQHYNLHYNIALVRAGIGGPLIDFDGNLIGMNFYDKYANGTPYLPLDFILDVLRHFEKKRTVDEAGLDDYASKKLDWTIACDSSIMLNRWHVPLPTWYHPDDLKRHDCEMKIHHWSSCKLFL